MTTAIDILAFLLPLGYGVIFGLYIRHFLSESDSDGIFLGSWGLYVVLALHAVLLVLQSAHTGHFPIATEGEFFSLLALSVGATYALAERKHSDANTGPFFVGIVLLFQFLGSLWLGDPGSVPDRTRNPVYSSHVIFTVFGFAGLTVSSLYAVMYILLDRQLKSRDLGLIFRRMPPLSVLENMSKLAMLSGVVLLGVGLGLGHYVAFEQFTQFNLLAHPIIIVADIAWLAYVVGLVVAETRGLSGIRMGYLAVGGYLAFMITMTVVLSQFGAFHNFQ